MEYQSGQEGKAGGRVQQRPTSIASNRTFSTHFEIDGVVIYFFDSDFKFLRRRVGIFSHFFICFSLFKVHVSFLQVGFLQELDEIISWPRCRNALLTHQFLPRCMECRRGLTMRFLSFRPSVCPSVKRVHCDKTEERHVQIFIPYPSFFKYRILVF